jgi:hypothetical protein
LAERIGGVDRDRDPRHGQQRAGRHEDRGGERQPQPGGRVAVDLRGQRRRVDEQVEHDHERREGRADEPARGARRAEAHPAGDRDERDDREHRQHEVPDLEDLPGVDAGLIPLEKERDEEQDRARADQQHARLDGPRVVGRADGTGGHRVSSCRSG